MTGVNNIGYKAMQIIFFLEHMALSSEFNVVFVKRWHIKVQAEWWKNGMNSKYLRWTTETWRDKNEWVEKANKLTHLNIYLPPNKLLEACTAD